LETGGRLAASVEAGREWELAKFFDEISCENPNPVLSIFLFAGSDPHLARRAAGEERRRDFFIFFGVTH
jgi:hypothetical protein